MPGLDGLRAIAVLAVVAYHLGLGWAGGGLLGVGIFFTLSGYLITDILLGQLDEQGFVSLGSFWLARARRLLPALFLMLIVVMAWVTTIGPHQPPDFRGAVASAVGYANNWWLIFRHVSYFAQFGTPSPLGHLWSLSIEEQFYLLWPFILLAGVRLFPAATGSLRSRLGGAILGLAVASAVLMAALYDPHADPSRVYYGTDTRALELLFGAALATVWPSRHLLPGIAPSARRILDGAGAAGLVLMGVMIWRTGQFSPFLYRGGFVVLSLGTLLALAALAHPAARLGSIVGCAPLRWIGERSYGIYLWHFPIIVLTTPTGADVTSLWRNVAQVAATFAVAALSWKYVEQPIRHGALRRLRVRAREGGLGLAQLTRPEWAGLAAGTVVTGLAVAGLAGVGVGPEDAGALAGPTQVHQTSRSATPATTIDRNRVACKSVVHIGDSTSLGLVSANYLPQPRMRMDAQYGRIGATTQHFEIDAGQSIYETFEGNPNAHDIARGWRKRGFGGCWVFALGTNEAADVAVGSVEDDGQRIGRMMSVAHGQPVLWLTVKTLVTSGPYAEPRMQQWNHALVKACRRYPNMRVYDWADDVRDSWFIQDGIHFTTPGYAARAKFIAQALLDGFPSGQDVARQPGTSCVIHPDVPAPRHSRRDPGQVKASRHRQKAAGVGNAG